MKKKEKVPPAGSNAESVKKERSARLTKILYTLVLLSFILPIGFIIVRLIFSPDVSENAAGYHSRADYVLMLVECLLGIIVIHIPSMLAKRFEFKLPTLLYILYIVFLYCAIFLGEVRSFYYIIPHWDTILHTMSSIMTGFFGVMVVYILNRDEHVVVKLSPFFISLFAFSFAVTIGSLWEIYEYTFDGILGLNMQKFATSEGVNLVGHEALRDTMKDIIVDALGALCASVIGYISIKFEKPWFKPELTDEESEKAAVDADAGADTDKKKQA